MILRHAIAQTDWRVTSGELVNSKVLAGTSRLQASVFAVNDSEPKDPLEPLWQKAHEAARQGDVPGTLFVWKLLAEKGTWQICARIGDLYERGAVGVAKNQEQALYWYRKAVFEGDDPIAHVGLGRAYYNGMGVERDLASALKHFERAFSAGLPQAGIYLGIMHYFGVGVERDISRGEKCFEMAATADYPYAKFFLARIAFRRGRLLRGLKLWIDAWLVGNSIAKQDPADPRLLGIELPIQ